MRMGAKYLPTKKDQKFNQRYHDHQARAAKPKAPPVSQKKAPPSKKAH